MKNNDEYIQSIKAKLQRCHGYDGDETATTREQAWDYYFQRARKDEPVGRSHVVSHDVSAMVEANLASAMEAISSDNLAEFDAHGQGDEDQAQLESDVVTHFVMKKSNGKVQLREAFKDALLLRNGVIKVSVSEKTTTRTQIKRNVDPLAAEVLKEQFEKVKYNADEQEAYITATRTFREFKCEAVPMENFLYWADWHSTDVQDIPLCAERHMSSRSELIELFPKKKSVIQDLNGKSVDWKVDAAARNPHKRTTEQTGIDESQDQIEWYECYLLADRDGDGISERRKVCLAGDELLDDYPVNIVPYAVGTAIIRPHRLEGISLYDKLKQVQDLGTGLRRLLMDGLNASTMNGVAAIGDLVEDGDLTNPRPNRVIRVKRGAGDVRAAVMPLNILDTSANIQANIQALNRERSELGGAALDMQSAQLQIGGDGMGSMGLDRAYSVAEQQAADFLDTLATTLVRSVFLIAHATMREYYNEPVEVKVGGRWRTAVPSEWPVRDTVTIKPGMSAGERTRRANALRTVLADQVALSDRGLDGVLVDGERFYRTFMDWARVSDIPNPEKYMIDPASPEAQQAEAMKTKEAQLQQKLKIALMQHALGIKQLEIAEGKYEFDADLVFKVWKETLDTEKAEAQIAAPHIAQLLQNAQGKRDERSDKDEGTRAAK